MMGQAAWATRRADAKGRALLADGWARAWSLFVLAYLGLAYWLLNYPLQGEFSPDTNIYIVRPAVWGGLGVLSYLLWRRLGDRPLTERAFVALSALAAVFSVSVLVCSGLMFGFGHSPYARSAMHMAQNTWYLAAVIFGLEMSRSYLVAVWSKFNATLAITVVALIYAAIWLTPGQFDSVATGNQESLHLFGRTFLPGVSESIMATFLVSLGGPLPAFIYHMSLESFRWLSPALPKFNWTEAAFIGTLTPAVAMLIVRDAYFSGASETPADADDAKKGRGVSPLLLFAGALFVAAIWLNTGMFGVSPYLVSGPSMRPGLAPGDLVVSRHVDAESIQIGDIIRFRAPRGDIIHRVMRIEHTQQGLVFTTKGDNNNTEDPSIPATQVEGKVIFDVPYVGWIPIKLKDIVTAW